MGSLRAAQPDSTFRQRRYSGVCKHTSKTVAHRRVTLCQLIACCVSLTMTASAARAQSRPALQFNRDIRPILSERCFQCHGPDSITREADLRLDTEAGLDAVIMVANPGNSELLKRIHQTDPDLQMPPPESGQSLTPQEIQTLEAWIQQGAAWQQHWSLIPPSRPQLPAAVWPERASNPIDPFIQAALRDAGLQPSPAANKTALIRRVTFDLTGLPPTLQEIDDFLADDSASAWERVVDRLLDSSAYGERMTTVWLDAARYADSHGYSLDRRRVMWPWRDWVIAAFNSNMPFDQFTIEQLAGDLLPNATVSQQVATGFNRNHPIQSEGGVINEEYRVETVVDRVETTAAVFLGLTMGCARCHDHKYDPISQQDFYRFYALFNNVPETAHVGNRDNDADKPFVKAPSVLQEQQIAELQRAIQQAETAVQAEQNQTAPQPVEKIWIDDELPPGAQPFGNGGGPQQFLFVSKDDHPVHSGTKSSHRSSSGRGQHGFQGAQPLTISAGTKLFTWVFLDPDNPPREIMLQWNGPAGWEHRAWWGENLIDWGTNETPSRRFMGPLPETGHWVRLEVDAGSVGLAPGSQISGWAFTQFDGNIYWDSAGLVTTPETPQMVRLNSLRSELQSVMSEQPTVMVMAEMTPRRKTWVLTRGQYDQPSDQEVQPQIPEILGQLPALPPNAEGSESPGVPNRLSLAKWLVSRDNPLTARVAVNRYWQLTFGTGLVATPEDFGSQGTAPSHPELLDWLAEEFVDSGWNMKALHKLLLMSATYQQASTLSPALLAADPHNRLLARSSRYRLPAEMIRDQALAVSGLLVRSPGGPSVRPYQPPGLWDDVVYGNVPRFQQDHGAKLYRRTLYTFWKRSVPPPNLQIFDAPSREACVLQRSRTNTPLAALVLMNDPTYVEAARVLAERTQQEAGESDPDRLRWLFRTVTSRPPTDREFHLLTRTLQQARTRYQADPNSAAQLLTVGEFPADPQLNAVETAAFSSISSALLNTDEVISRN